jgi:hypothetical protein
VLFQAIHDVICNPVAFILGQTLPKAPDQLGSPAQGVSYGEAKRVPLWSTLAKKNIERTNLKTKACYCRKTMTCDWSKRLNGPVAAFEGLKTMKKSHLKLVAPAIVNRTVAPKRPPNKALRTREYLTEAEVQRLIEAAKGNRYGHRDATMVLVAYRHGLRAAEIVDLRWDQTDFQPQRYTFVGSSKGPRQRTLSWATSYGRYGGFTESKTPSRPSFSLRSEGHHSVRRASPA